nr:hypothetical protein [uncultured Sphingosinicella sp.]
MNTGRVGMRALIVIGLGLSLSGCIAQTAASIVTLPVKVVSKTADVLTTSQSEADEKRGRAMRKQEEREAKERRRAEREARRERERND